MNTQALERRLREEGQALRTPAPRGLAERILEVTRDVPPGRRVAWQPALAAAALLLATAGGLWTWWPERDSVPVRPATTLTFDTLQQVARLERVGETWGLPALGSVEATLWAELDGWQRDAERATRGVLDGIPGPMRRFLPLGALPPGTAPPKRPLPR